MWKTGTGFTGRMPLMSTNQQCQREPEVLTKTRQKLSHSHILSSSSKRQYLLSTRVHTLTQHFNTLKSDILSILYCSYECFDDAGEGRASGPIESHFTDPTGSLFQRLSLTSSNADNLDQLNRYRKQQQLHLLINFLHLLWFIASSLLSCWVCYLFLNLSWFLCSTSGSYISNL